MYLYVDLSGDVMLYGQLSSRMIVTISEYHKLLGGTLYMTCVLMITSCW